MSKRGSILIASQELSRYAKFTQSLVGLRLPAETGISWSLGVDVASGLNQAIRNAIKVRAADWIWIISDDHTFKPDILLRLLARKVSVVSPLVMTRKPPFMPVAFNGKTESGEYRYIPLEELPSGGMIGDIEPLNDLYGSTAGMLIRGKVLDAVGDPWFEVGKIRSDKMGEDLYLNEKIRGKGFKVHIDLDVTMGHISPITYLPTRQNDKWMTGLDLEGVMICLS